MKYNRTITLNIREIADLKEGKKSLDEILNKSYSHKPHLASLPHDRRTNDPDKLKERFEEIVNRIEESKKKEIEVIDKIIPLEHELKDVEEELSHMEDNVETHKKNYEDAQSSLREAFKELNPLVDEIREEEGYYESGPQIWGEADSRIYDYLDAVNELEDIANTDLNGISNKTAYELINEKFKKSKLHELLDDDKKDYSLGGAVKEFGRAIRTETKPQNPTINSLLEKLGSDIEDMGNYEGAYPRYGDWMFMDLEYSAELYGIDRSESNIKRLNSRKEKLESQIKDNDKKHGKIVTELEDYEQELRKTSAKLKRVKDKENNN